MFITELSIKRPTVSWVMSLILIIFGLFVFWKLPVRELPNGIQPPVVQVQVDYKSASASIVDQEVTQVVEDVIGGLTNKMTNMIDSIVGPFLNPINSLFSIIGQGFNIEVNYVITDMNQPLGMYSGVQCEIIESIEALKGNG